MKYAPRSFLEPYLCVGCIHLKKNKHTGLYGCRVLIHFYFSTVPPNKTCRTYSEDRKKWAEALDDIVKYSTFYEGHTPNYLVKERDDAVKRVNKYEGLDKVYREEVHKKLQKPPTGEKSEGTLFGKQRMKDNRWKPIWPED